MKKQLQRTPYLQQWRLETVVLYSSPAGNPTTVPLHLHDAGRPSQGCPGMAASITLVHRQPALCPSV